MKRRIVLLVLGLVLLFGLSSCYIFRSNHFIGDWSGTMPYYDITATLTFTFDSDMNFSGTMTIPSYYTLNMNGTYDYDDTTLTIVPTGETGFTATYDFSDLYRTLTITPTDAEYMTGEIVLERQ